MAKVTFIGDGKSDPESVTTQGYTFTKGKAIEVNDPKALGRLASNPSFKVEGLDKATVEVPITTVKPHAPDDRDVALPEGKPSVPEKPLHMMTAQEQADFEKERGVRIPPWQDESQAAQVEKAKADQDAKKADKPAPARSDNMINPAARRPGQADR